MPKSENFQWVDHLLECSLNLAYAFNAVPFKLVSDHTKKAYLIKSSTWRKYVCFISSLLTAICSCVFINASLKQASLRTPSVLFNLAPEVGSVFLCFMFWYVVWLREQEIANFFSLKSLENCEKWEKQNRDGDTDTKKEKIIAYVFCMLLVLTVVICEIIKLFASMASALNQLNLNPAEYFLGFLYNLVRSGSLLEDMHYKFLRVDEMNSFQIGACILIGIFSIYYKIFIALAILLCSAGVGVVFKHSWDFTSFLSEETSDITVMRTLQAFKEDVESINQIIGPIMFAIAIVCAPPFFVANFALIVTTWNIDTMMIWITWMIYAAVLFTAAEVAYKTDEIRELILACGEGDNEEELFAIFVEVTHNPIGIRGMECMTVTYRYMAQMFSAVVTFVIILLQFVSDPSQRWAVSATSTAAAAATATATN